MRPQSSSRRPTSSSRRRPGSIFFLLACLVLSSTATAQQYPAKPIRLIIASAAGGGIDLLARIMSPKFSELMGQLVIIDNRGGAGGTIGYEYGIRAAPDGYTLTIISATYTVNPSFYQLKFDAAADCTPISQLVHFPHVIVVHPSLPAKNVKELIALARTRPGQIFYSSAGPGTVGFFWFEDGASRGAS